MSKHTYAAPDMDTSQSIRIEKIKNGFLAHHSMSGPDIRGGYQHETHYHRTNPIAPGKRSQIARTLAKFHAKAKTQELSILC